MSGPIILSIESSCDETGIALVEDGRRIHANVVASQVALHAPTGGIVPEVAAIDGGRRILGNVVASQVAMHAASGGIVPEVAARAHLRWIVPVLDEVWADAGVAWSDIDAVAVTYGPGLAGSLLVGVNFAKALRPGCRTRGRRICPSPCSPSLRSSSRVAIRSSSRCAIT